MARRGLVGPVLPWVFALALVALVGNRLQFCLRETADANRPLRLQNF